MKTTRLRRFAAAAAVFLCAATARGAGEDPPPPPPAPAPGTDPVTEEIDVVRKRQVLPEEKPKVKLDSGMSHDTIGPEITRDLVPWSIEEVVDLMPGFSSRLYSGDEYLRPSISARGMYDNGFTEFVGVHVDGLNYSRLFYGWTALSIFPYSSERIYASEVYRGGEAVRWGPTTIGGVINFITPPVPEKWSAGTRTTLGEHGFNSTYLWGGGTDPKTGVGFLVEQISRTGETFRDNSNFRVNDTNAKLLVPMGPDAYFLFHTFYWRDIHQLIGRLTYAQLRDNPEQNPTDRRVKWTGWSYGEEATYHRRTGKDSWFEVQAYDRFGHQNLPSLQPAATPTAFRSQVIDSSNRGIYFRGEAPLELGIRHVLHGGLRLHNERIDRHIYQDALATGVRTNISRTMVDTDAIAIHLDDTVKFGDLTLNGGVRYEILDSDGRDRAFTAFERDFHVAEPLFGASANYKFTDHFAAFTNYHQSFRAPQTFVYNFTTNRQELEFEHGDTGEVGVRADDVKGFSGSVVYWKTKVSDFIELDPLTNLVENHGSFASRGWDFVLAADGKKVWEPLDGWSVYTKRTIQKSEFTNGPNDGNEQPHVPGDFWSGKIRYDHRPTGFYTTLGFRSKDTEYATSDNLFTSPGYTTFNGRVGWRKDFSRSDKRRVLLEVAVSAENLLDREFYRRHNATQFVPGSPRTLFFEFGITVDL